MSFYINVYELQDLKETTFLLWLTSKDILYTVWPHFIYELFGSLMANMVAYFMCSCSPEILYSSLIVFTLWL